MQGMEHHTHCIGLHDIRRHRPIPCNFSPAASTRRRISRSVTGRVLQLIEPVETHRLHDAVTDHDQPRFARAVGVEMLVDGEGGYIDEVAALPFIALRLSLPLIVELVEAIELEIPMQVEAAAFDD